MSDKNTLLNPITNLVSNTTQKSGTNPCTEYNTYHIDQNWNICTSGTKTLRFEVPRKMIFLIEADQLSSTKYKFEYKFTGRIRFIQPTV